MWNFCSTFNNFCTVDIETLWNHPNAPLLIKSFQTIPRTWQEVLWFERFQCNKYNKTNYIPSWIDTLHLANIIKELLCDEFWQNCELKFLKRELYGEFYVFVKNKSSMFLGKTNCWLEKFVTFQHNFCFGLFHQISLVWKSFTTYLQINIELFWGCSVWSC